MNNPPTNPPNQPTPLPPPQQQQQQPPPPPPQQQQYHYPQNPPPYPYPTPYYYQPTARPYPYNTYPQPPPPPPPTHQPHPHHPPPHPPPSNPYYNPYYNPYQTRPPISYPPNNPPPPPPKSLINPNHNHNNKSMVSYTNNNIQSNNHSTHPQSLQMYIEKCWNRFKSLPNYLSNSENKDKLQKQLKGKVNQSKLNKTLFIIDWKNEPFPQYLQHLIQINDKSNAISPKKRKAESGWNGENGSRKVAKTSILHRDINGITMDKKTKSFLHNKSDSDMSCSEEDTSPININKNKNGNINFQINRNHKLNNKIKFKNIFKMDNESTDTTTSNESEHEEEAYVLSKGRGFITKKIKKKKFKLKNKNKNKKKSKNKHKSKKSKKKQSTFSWDNMDGIESLNVKSKLQKNNKSNDNMEIDRILERKKRFEQQKSQQNDGDNNSNNNSNKFKRKKRLSMNDKNLSADMKQLIDWHSKRVIGTNTKVEKDYFRLTSEPNPSEVRTLNTLKKAFDLLKIRWKTKNKENKCDYLYVCGQFKSLRQDLRVQHIRNKFSINVYECNAKICLEVGDLSEYNQCQGQLKELYIENDELFNNSNYIEFLSYRLLYEAVCKNYSIVSNIIKIEKKYIQNNKLIKDTLEIINAIQSIDYYKFFKLYKYLTYHGQCILNQIIYKIRYQTLNRIIISYSPSTYPIDKLITVIGFKKRKECIQYLKNTGCVVQKINQNKFVLNCKASRGKIKEFIPKSEDDQLGVTHGSVYHKKNQDETSIVKFLRKM